MHHVTYARVGGGELMSDLRVVCPTCHLTIHGLERDVKTGSVVRASRNRPSRKRRKRLRRLARIGLVKIPRSKPAKPVVRELDARAQAELDRVLEINESRRYVAGREGRVRAIKEQRRALSQSVRGRCWA